MKYSHSLVVAAVERPREGYVLLKLRLPAEVSLSDIEPGQFVELLAPRASHTFLRRPISVNFVDHADRTLWLLIHEVGEGTRAFSALSPGEKLDCVYALGNGFPIDLPEAESYLLVGGGVGTAPLLYYGSLLHAQGRKVTFLLGGRRSVDLMQLDDFGRYGRVCLTTEDGSTGERGFVTAHSVWATEHFDVVATCGPKPMMMAVATKAAEVGIDSCYASLENLMACGLGACLCCVEKNADGHNVCVCKEGPVFNVRQLSWQSYK